LNEILFGAKIVPKVDDSSISQKKKSKFKKADKSDQNSSSYKSTNKNFMVEVIASMCVSVMTATTSVNGIWRLHFDPVASHALLCATMVNKLAKATASKLIEHRCRQSLSFLTQLPFKLNSLSQPPDVSVEHDDQRLNSIMDQIFFDPLCGNDKCIIENISRKKDDDLGDDEWNGSSFVFVARESSIEELCKQLSTSLTPIANSLHFESDDVPYRFAADSAASHLQLG